MLCCQNSAKPERGIETSILAYGTGSRLRQNSAKPERGIETTHYRSLKSVACGVRTALSPNAGLKQKSYEYALALGIGQNSAKPERGIETGQQARRGAIIAASEQR